MDEVFWASVVKRWSDASESVIKLKKELADLQEEKTLYTHAYGPLPRSRSEHNERTPFEHKSSSSSEQNANLDYIYSSSSTIKDELQDAEIGLGKAKAEYHKLQHDLSLSLQTIDDLTSKNEGLIRSHREEIEALRKQYANVPDARKEAHLASPMSATAEDTPRQSPSYPSNLQESSLVADLQRQIDNLREALETKEAEKGELQHELESTRDRLHKSEDNIKALLASIIKLQEIARHSAHGSLHPVPVNVLHPGSRRASKASFASNRSHTQDHENNHPPKAKSMKSVKSFSISFPVAPQISAKTVVEDDASSFIPLKRENAILNLPPVPNMTSIDESENLFDRVFLKHILGDGVQALIDHFSETNQKFDKKTVTSSYLCPTLDHHPWCPSVAGQHGFLFVGLGKDKDVYKSPVVRHLFVGLPKGPSTHRAFRYLGKYRVLRVNALTLEEWYSLSEETKLMYANLTQDKGKDPRSLAEILSSYDKGELQVPCVQLQCLNFDKPFYSALVSHNSTEKPWSV